MFHLSSVFVGSSFLVTPPYAILDTGVTECYDDAVPVTCPEQGEAFFGQDASYQHRPFNFQDNGDGTVTDLTTGLMWQKTPVLTQQFTFDEAATYAGSLALAGHTDWRVPSIKELYSIVLFTGNSDDNVADCIPYIDTTVFDYENVTETFGDRSIDMQFWSSTEYVGHVMGNIDAAFGMNFADGRIKGYPSNGLPNGDEFSRYVRCVRGNTVYGVNDFEDAGNGTIVDHATGLEWAREDAGEAMTWEAAIAWCESLELDGHDDWRLPDAKELHSIVDYTRAPDAVDPDMQGPAINPIFNLSDADAWFWASTTLLETPIFATDGSEAIYIAFGQAWGYMCPPGVAAPCPGQGSWMNVHGAGAQRCNPKTGDPADWPYGRGPQGDEVRIFNDVRAVRTYDTCSGDVDGDGSVGADDLLAAIAAWGPCEGCAADLNGDGAVNVDDILPLLADWDCQ
ncbi:MAG: DUF1566 domain-containing protein [Phycisphaerales bacterium]|nr:DUF1566 domain-containing protein [Phycisphaerales bacterium]